MLSDRIGAFSSPIICLSLLAAAPAGAQSLAIDWYSIDAGGGVSTGGAYTLRGVIGQHDTALATAGPIEIRAGFLAGVSDALCPADCDGSGDLDFFDFLCFQNAFAAQQPYADCDDNGAFDFFDFLCFQNEFAAGCP